MASKLTVTVEGTTKQIAAALRDLALGDEGYAKTVAERHAKENARAGGLDG